MHLDIVAMIAIIWLLFEILDVDLYEISVIGCIDIDVILANSRSIGGRLRSHDVLRLLH